MAEFFKIIFIYHLYFWSHWPYMLFPLASLTPTSVPSVPKFSWWRWPEISMSAQSLDSFCPHISRLFSFLKKKTKIKLKTVFMLLCFYILITFYLAVFYWLLFFNLIYKHSISFIYHQWHIQLHEGLFSTFQFHTTILVTAVNASIMLTRCQKLF